ncbi:MAG: flagellin lysine-N-methylase [Acutalibacteraceae bacterium]|nr:flagellin lysine-N-methylase [Acutalibacteraceae bacterium]
MIVIKPKFFDAFKCVADRCPDTCCAGWDVEIDGESAEKYKNETGSLKPFFDKHLTTDEDGYIFSLVDGCCPLLDENKLCRIQLAKGEEALCETCRLFPRYFDDYGDIRETGLGLGCPEAARILLSPETEVCLGGKAQSKDKIYNILSDKREEFFSILENKRYDLKLKLSSVLFSAAEFQSSIDCVDWLGKDSTVPFSEFIKVLEKMEFISEERRSFLLSLSDEKAVYRNSEKYSDDIVRLFKYYLMRYMMTACFDLDLLTKVKYGIFACIITKRIYDSFPELSFDDRVRILYSYSKEVEYSPVNLDILDNSLYDGFTVAELINLL